MKPDSRTYDASKETRYAAWCDRMERRYTTMPRWYWNATERRKRFEAQDNPGIAMQNGLHALVTGEDGK